MQLKFSIHRRRSIFSSKTIWLVIPAVLSHLNSEDPFKDNAERMIKCLEIRDAIRIPIRIFLDICRFLGDHSAFSKVWDVIKHSFQAPCTHCSFRPRTCQENQNRPFQQAYYRELVIYAKSQKPLCFHASPLSEKESKYLGMKDVGLKRLFKKEPSPLVRPQMQS